jgi:hypothetical protein
LGGDSSCMRTVESKEVGKCSSRGFFDDRQGRRDLEDVELACEDFSKSDLKGVLTFVFKIARSISEITPT